MPRTRIKICGITRPEDAALAADLGADAIGLNFFAGPRRIDRDAAHRIGDTVSTLVTLVGLTDRYLDIDRGQGLAVRDLMGGYPALRLMVFQTYGIDLDKVGDPGVSYECWPVFRVQSRNFAVDIQVAVEVDTLRGIWPHTVTAIVLDTAVKGQLGGTGQTFNWNWIAEARAAGELEGLPPIILAGGLTPDNVAEAIRVARPYAVDVSSGVEFPNQPGKKDPARVKAFIEAVRSTD